MLLIGEVHMTIDRSRECSRITMHAPTTGLRAKRRTTRMAPVTVQGLERSALSVNTRSPEAGASISEPSERLTAANSSARLELSCSP